MDTIVALIFGISALAVVVFTFWSSVTRTKSGLRWMKGYNLKRRMSTEEVVELLNKIEYPEKETLTVGEDGKIIYSTKLYSYSVETSTDSNGYTNIGLVINWSKVSKRMKKKVAFDWDNIYQFLAQEVEGKDSIDAMQFYEKNKKMQKLSNIAGIICIASMIVFMIINL